MPAPAAGLAVLLRTALLPLDVLESFGASATASALDSLIEADRDLTDRAARASDALFTLAGPGGVTRGPERHRQRNGVLALRRAVHNRRPLDAGMLDRAAPLLPDDLRKTLGELDTARTGLDAARSDAQGVFESERQEEAAALLAAAQSGLFREGVRLAGRSLYRALAKLERKDPAGWKSEENHVASKIAAYLVRAATKTSPNSLFAAVARAEPGPQLASAGEAAPTRVVTRLNVFEARKVAACLAADPALRPAIRPRPNPTLRRVPDGWTWWRPASLRRENDDEVSMEAGENPVLETVLGACHGGDRTWPEVVETTSRASGFPPEEVDRFLERLAETGFLIAELELSTGEPRPLAALARAARAADLHPPWADEVEAVEHLVDTLPPAGTRERIPALEAIETRLGALPHVRTLEPDQFFRVDAAGGFRATLPDSVVEEVSRAVDTYVRLFAALYPPPRRSPFAARFLERFPPDVDIALLDLYHGVFEPEDRLQPGSFPVPEDLGLEETGTYRRFLDHLETRAAEGSREVGLTEKELAGFCASADPPPWMCGALFQIAAPGGADDDPGMRIPLNALFHGSGLALSRFHELLEPEHPDSGRIARTLRRGWLSLVPEGALPAEIVYSHWGRTANAGLRPRLFEHEIELPGEKAHPESKTIPLSELVVRYDTATGRFCLRWAAGNTEVVPLLSSGVRPEGFVDFLVHLGTQSLMPVAHFPGFDRPGGPVHWPRFTLGRVVLFRERWVFDPVTGPAAFGDPQAPATPGPAWFEAVHRWRRAHGLPRRVFVASGRKAKPFHLDLESPLCAEQLRRFLAGGEAEPPSRFTVAEMLPGPEDSWLRDAAGRYASEFLIQVSGPRPRDPETGGAPS